MTEVTKDELKKEIKEAFEAVTKEVPEMFNKCLQADPDVREKAFVEFFAEQAEVVPNFIPGNEKIEEKLFGVVYGFVENLLFKKKSE